MYLYIKALHIIFIVTWFAGLFYIVRLFIYNTEADRKNEPERTILQQQFSLMIRRLWLGITWPSAILTAIFGPWMWFLLEGTPPWLAIKIIFVAGLYVYHFTLHVLYLQQTKGVFKYSSQQLRIWNEIATVFLVSIIFIATIKQSLSVVWGLVGLIAFVLLLLAGIRLYKIFRS